MYESNAKVQLLTALANHELDEIISCADMILPHPYSSLHLILPQGYTTEQYEEFLDALSYIPDLQGCIYFTEGDMYQTIVTDSPTAYKWGSNGPPYLQEGAVMEKVNNPLCNVGIVVELPIHKEL